MLVAPLLTPCTFELVRVFGMAGDCLEAGLGLGSRVKKGFNKVPTQLVEMRALVACRDKVVGLELGLVKTHLWLLLQSNKQSCECVADVCTSCSLALTFHSRFWSGFGGRFIGTSP